MVFLKKVIAFLRQFVGCRREGMTPYLSLIDRLGKIANDRGDKGLIEYLKATRLALLHYLSGEYPSKKVPGVLVTSDGIPLVLEHWHGKLREFKSSDQPNKYG